jgi:hypothetical protein
LTLRASSTCLASDLPPDMNSLLRSKEAEAARLRDGLHNIGPGSHHVETRSEDFSYDENLRLQVRIDSAEVEGVVLVRTC